MAPDLTEQTILDLSGEDELCQVRELVLREHGLSEVGPLLEQLTALEVLSLSNNAVHSLAGCAARSDATAAKPKRKGGGSSSSSGSSSSE